MVLNGRKQTTQFIKGKKISEVSSLKQRLLLYVVMWKSFYYCLYTTLHLFPGMSFACIKVKKLCIFESRQTPRSATKWSSIFAVSSFVASCFYNEPRSRLCSSAFIATLRAGRPRASDS